MIPRVFMAFHLPFKGCQNPCYLPSITQETCGQSRSTRKLRYLVPWPTLFWIMAMMTPNILCAMPLMIPEEDPNIMLVWNVSYVTMSPLGKPQQVRLSNSICIVQLWAY